MSAEVVSAIWRDEFLGMYEFGGLFNLTWHLQASGHPSRLLWLRELIRFIKKREGVWWATGVRSPSTGSRARADEAQALHWQDAEIVP